MVPRIVLVAALCSTVLVLRLLAPPEPSAERDRERVECASCSGHGHAPAPLRVEEYERLLCLYGAEPMSGNSQALETLLFHGAQVGQLLGMHGAGALDAERASFLARELRRTAATVAFRIVDASGAEHVRLEPTRVRIGEKAHLTAASGPTLRPPEFSGTVYRVGLDHLWARF